MRMPRAIRHLDMLAAAAADDALLLLFCRYMPRHAAIFHAAAAMLTLRCRRHYALFFSPITRVDLLIRRRHDTDAAVAAMFDVSFYADATPLPPRLLLCHFAADAATPYAYAMLSLTLLYLFRHGCRTAMHHQH